MPSPILSATNTSLVPIDSSAKTNMWSKGDQDRLRNGFSFPLLEIRKLFGQFIVFRTNAFI